MHRLGTQSDGNVRDVTERVYVVDGMVAVRTEVRRVKKELAEELGDKDVYWLAALKP